MDELTMKEKVLLKIIEDIVDGFQKAFPNDFLRTIASIDKELATIGLKRGNRND